MEAQAKIRGIEVAGLQAQLTHVAQELVSERRTAQREASLVGGRGGAGLVERGERPSGRGVGRERGREEGREGPCRGEGRGGRACWRGEGWALKGREGRVLGCLVCLSAPAW